MNHGRFTTDESVLYVPGENQVKTALGEYKDAPSGEPEETTEPQDAVEGEVTLTDHDAEDTLPGNDGPVTVAPDSTPETTEESTATESQETQPVAPTSKPEKAKN